MLEMANIICKAKCSFEEFFFILTPFECNSSDISIKHDVRIGRIVIHVRIELSAVAVPERVAKVRVSAHPVAQLYDRGLVRGEVDEAVSGEYCQHIEIIGQIPVHSVGLAIRTQVWGIDEENHTRNILVSFKHLLIITGGNDQSVEIVTTRRIVSSLYVVVQGLFLKVGKLGSILH